MSNAGILNNAIKSNKLHGNDKNVLALGTDYLFKHIHILSRSNIRYTEEIIIGRKKTIMSFLLLKLINSHKKQCPAS